MTVRPAPLPVAALALAALLLAPAAPAAGPGSPRSFVKVAVTEAEAAVLARDGFDLAGYDREAGEAGIVATAGELERLGRRGLCWTLADAGEAAGPAAAALSDYTDPQEMSAFLDQVAAAYPNLAKKVLLQGVLFEGQKVWALKITKDVDLPNERPVFLLDAQHHAREVMTAEITRDAVDYLTSRYATDAQVRNWVDNLNVWVIPVVNPDGAMYVFTTDPTWRKNRHTGCGVDNNRNYSVYWGACNGSSGLCADETFRGTAPDSEPETQAVEALTQEGRPLFALSYHSYGQYILYSYGCADPDEKVILDGIAQGLNGILVKDNGAPGGWATGPIWSTIYPADGGSVDTQYGRYGTYAYVIEVNSASFQPSYAVYRDVTVQRQRTAWQYFLDKTLTAPQIRGKVTDAGTGQPLAAAVSVQEVSFTHGEQPRRADARGLYHWLAAANATYHLTFSMPGYCTETRTVAVGTGPATVDVALGYPAAPSGLAAAPGTNSVALSWNAVAGVPEYRVYRGLAPGGPYALARTVAAPAISMTDAPVSGQVTYYYVVRSYLLCESPDSAEVSARPAGPCTMAPVFAGVGSVTAPLNSTCTLSLSWAPATAYCGGPVTYRVYRGTSASFVPGPANLIAAGLAGTGYADHAALSNGTTYYYVVCSVDGSSGAEDANAAVLGAMPRGPLPFQTCTVGAAPVPKEASPAGAPLTCAKGAGSAVVLAYTPA